MGTKALPQKKTDYPDETASNVPSLCTIALITVFPFNDDNEKQREVCAFLNRLACPQLYEGIKSLTL